MIDFFSAVRRLVVVFFGALASFLGFALVFIWLGLAEPLGLFPLVIDPEVPGFLARGGIGLVLLGGGLFFLVSGLYFHPEPRVFKLGREGLTVNQREVRDLVQHRAQDVVGVSACEVRGVRMRGHRWRIRCELSVKEGVGIEQASAEVQSRVRESLERFTGLPVDRVDVEAHQAPPPH